MIPSNNANIFVTNNTVVPQLTDVLCVRSGETNRHPGTLSFRQLIRWNEVEYCLSPNSEEKKKISISIVGAIRERGSRFLSKKYKDGPWYVIGENEAIKKTSQALREKQPQVKNDWAKHKQLLSEVFVSMREFHNNPHVRRLRKTLDQTLVENQPIETLHPIKANESLYFSNTFLNDGVTVDSMTHRWIDSNSMSVDGLIQFLEDLSVGDASQSLDNHEVAETYETKSTDSFINERLTVDSMICRGNQGDSISFNNLEQALDGMSFADVSQSLNRRKLAETGENSFPDQNNGSAQRTRNGDMKHHEKQNTRDNENQMSNSFEIVLEPLDRQRSRRGWFGRSVKSVESIAINSSDTFHTSSDTFQTMKSNESMNLSNAMKSIDTFPCEGLDVTVDHLQQSLDGMSLSGDSEDELHPRKVATGRRGGRRNEQVIDSMSLCGTSVEELPQKKVKMVRRGGKRNKHLFDRSDDDVPLMTVALVRTRGRKY